jgi:3-deoxy-manno-octulosonate cytidylyltransferase (CMP-KDO synthetase)
MGSTRFPRKPLALIQGREMILRTLERARLAGCFDRVICATDSEEISKIVRNAGFDAVITPACATGTDRVAFAASLLHLPLVVNLQGDEPVADLDLLRQVSMTLQQDPGSWVTAASPLQPSDFLNTNVVKVRVEDGFASTFTRSTVSGADWWAHRGIYAYSLDALEEFDSLPQSSAERSNSLEQLRIIGLRPIRIVPTQSASLSVDIPDDIYAVESFLSRSNV